MLGTTLFSIGAVVAILMYHPFWPQPSKEVPTVPSGFTWGMSWHPYPGDASKDWNSLQELNIGLVRIDASFRELYPQPGKLELTKFTRLQQLVAEGKKRGFQMMINLGTYPDWSLQMLKKDPEGFFKNYRTYVKAVVEGLGDQVAYYQMGNEINTILDPIPQQWDGRICREARAIIDAYKPLNPAWKVKTVINFCDSFYIPWKGELKRLLDEASPSIDVIGYDFYPGNYSYPHDWGAWSLDYISEMMQKYQKEGAICETGCLALFGEGRQARWISESTRAMLQAIKRSPVSDRYVFAIFYELTDSFGQPFWMPATESSFGIIAQDGRRKPGFGALQEVILKSGAKK